MGVCGDSFVNFFPLRGEFDISMKRGIEWSSCLEWMLVKYFLLGMALVGILFSSGLLWVVKLINPVRRSVYSWVP